MAKLKKPARKEGSKSKVKGRLTKSKGWATQVESEKQYYLDSRKSPERPSLCGWDFPPQPKDPGCYQLNGSSSQDNETEGEVLDTFEGFVEKIEGDTAYVTLTSKSGPELVGKIPVAELARKGIKERRRFILRTIKVAPGMVRIDLIAVPDIPLTEEDRIRIDAMILQGIGDDDVPLIGD
jgi:hypothetical protein